MSIIIKTKYEKPEAIISVFDSDDVVTTSGYSLEIEGFGDEIYW